MAVVTTQQKVAALYTAIFNRAPDQSGLNFWTAQINAGTSFASVAAGFAQHEVFTTGIGALDNAGYVSALYTNILGSAGDTAGIAYWTARLAAGESKAAIVAEFVNGSLTIDIPALLASGGISAADAAAATIRQQTLTNKADVGIYFANTLGAASNLNPATISTSKAGLEADPIYKASQAAIANVTSTAASVQSAKDGIAVAAGSANPAQALLGQTFTLTAGIDNFVGDAGNNVFVGGNGANPTFGPADQLDGGAGTDTLKLYGGNVATGIPTIKNIENVYLNATTGNLNVSTIAGVTALELDNVGTGNTFTLGATQALKLSNQAGAVTVAGSVAGGVTLNGAGTAAAALTLNAPATSTSLNLTTTTQASNIVLTGAALTSVKVVGDQALTLNATGTAPLTSVDASAATAGVNYTNTDTLDLTFTGGAGADRVNLGASVTAADKLDGGAGVDTLAITTGGLTTAAVAGIKGFEVLETVGTTTQDASVFAPANVLTGLTVGYTAVGTTYTTAVTNLAATAKDNIKVSDTTVRSNVALSVKDFVSGGTTDTATVTYTGAVKTAASTLNFDNVDVLNLVSTGVAGTSNSIILHTTDLEKLVVTGNVATTVAADAASTGITEVDASGLKVAAGVAGLTFTQAASSTQNLLVTGSNAADTVIVTSDKGTVVANGGNDIITFGKAAATSGDLAVKLGAIDFVAGGNVTVNGVGAAVTTGVIDFTSAIENTLKVGGVNLGTSAADVLVGTALSATSNVAFIAAAGGTPAALQFDLNGDGVYTAGTDFAITLTGATSVTYNAAADVFVAA